MNIHIPNRVRNALVVVALSSTLFACGDNDDIQERIDIPESPAPAPTPPAMRSYDITVTNLSHAQPLSPVAVVINSGTSLWSVGQSASTELEYLAEGGDNSFITGLDDNIASGSGTSPIAPGNSETVSVSFEENDQAHLSIITMLVNTNDAFSGLNGMALNDLALDTSITVLANVYDAGTEANTESAGTIPGPVDGGTGFDATRDDVNFVSLHPGVVSSNDGLTGSVLSQAHRFDNPSIKIVVTRTE